MKKYSFIVFGLLVLSSLVSCGQNPSPEVKKYKNVLVDYAQLLDPALIKGDDGKYYLYVTEGNQKWKGPNTEQFVSKTPIYESSDMVNWSYKCDVFDPDDASKWKWDGAETLSFWSPEIAKIGNNYVYYYSLGKMGGSKYSGVGCATSSTPYGPWTHIEEPIITSEDVGNKDAIDPCIVQDNGNVYMFYGNYDGIGVIQLNATGTAVLHGAQPKIVAGVQLGSGGDDWTNFTAPYVKKINNKWCLFVSSGVWNNPKPEETNYYHTRVFTSTNLLGDYVDSSGKSATDKTAGDIVMTSNETFVGPGNVCVIPDNAGNYYIYFHTFVGKNDFSKRYLGLEKLDISGSYPKVDGKEVHDEVDYPKI